MDERGCVQYFPDDAYNEGRRRLETFCDSIFSHGLNLSGSMGPSFKCYHNLGHFQNARVEVLVG